MCNCVLRMYVCICVYVWWKCLSFMYAPKKADGFANEMH